MKIDILNPTAPMAQSGSSLRKMIQNSKDPLLDLFIRESLQNSADAGDDSDIDFVKVDFFTGYFNKASLNNTLEGITEKLNSRYPDDEYIFLAVKDTNTTGLKGPLKTSQIKNSEYGNLEKLVYQICKPQETPGSGGSWGMGKTIYFRMNAIGLVFYYSRTINIEGHYESRLCAAMVEDEKKADAIIPDVKGNKSGVAWWGMDKGDEMHSYPMTDEREIKCILDNFGIEPFNEKETGTIIILPYIEKDLLLNYNKTDSIDESGNSIVNYWDEDLEKYLRIAIQRWYAPRLDNPFYFNPLVDTQDKVFKYLKIFVNGLEMNSKSLEPIFQLIQDLYNEAFSKCFNCELSRPARFEGIKTAPVTYNRVSGHLGYLAYIKLDKSFLSNGDIEPLSYLGVHFDYSRHPHDDNRPIIAMTRRPGMIVEYNSLNWMLGDLPTTGPSEYIIALFVLNSIAVFHEDNKYNLEKYMREGGERADHIGWYDHALVEGGRSSNCISQMTRKTADILKEAYGQKEEKQDGTRFNGLGSLLGHILDLSPSRKGIGGTKKPQPPKPDGDDVKFIIRENQYKSNEILIEIEAFTKKKSKGTTCLFKIDSDTSPITVDSWEEEKGFEFPFNIINYDIIVSSYDSKAMSVSGNTLFSMKTMASTTSSKIYGLRIETLDHCRHLFHLIIKIKLELTRRDLRPIIDFK